MSYKILAPATGRNRGLELSSNSSTRLFVGSAFKAFVLGEELRQADSPDVVQTITERQLALDESVWSPDSATFNPPNLSGMVTERTAIEAMILHSDNTGADMCLKQAGTDNVRAFIASAGLTNTLIPESTRSFIGYLLGAPDYLTFTWQQYLDAANDPFVNPPLNTTQTLASSADDLVSYYSRGLQGEFFENDQTLNEFRAILSLGDVIWLLPVPLGVSAFAKGGEINVPGLPRPVRRGRDVLRRRVGLLLLHDQLDGPGAVRSHHGGRMGGRIQPCPPARQRCAGPLSVRAARRRAPKSARPKIARRTGPGF